MNIKETSLLYRFISYQYGYRYKCDMPESTCSLASHVIFGILTIPLTLLYYAIDIFFRPYIKGGTGKDHSMPEKLFSSFFVSVFLGGTQLMVLIEEEILTRHPGFLTIIGVILLTPIVYMLLIRLLFACFLGIVKIGDLLAPITSPIMNFIFSKSLPQSNRIFKKTKFPEWIRQIYKDIKNKTCTKVNYIQE